MSKKEAATEIGITDWRRCGRRVARNDIGAEIAFAEWEIRGDEQIVRAEFVSEMTRIKRDFVTVDDAERWLDGLLREIADGSGGQARREAKRRIRAAAAEYAAACLGGAAAEMLAELDRRFDEALEAGAGCEWIAKMAGEP